MANDFTLRLMDTHAGGDVSRMITGGVAPLPGHTVRAQMEYLQSELDELRKLLLFEPYGIPEMSVDLLVPPTDPQAAAGYIIMEVMGYPIYSGSNTICTATAVLELGIVQKQEGWQQFVLESPAGPVSIDALVLNDVVESITCAGLPSYIERYREIIDVPGYGQVNYSIAYSGGFYALVEAEPLGFELVLAEERSLSQCAHAIVTAIQQQAPLRHYELGDVGPLPFLHFMGPVAQNPEGLYQSRSATYVHPGVICRSTTGTGTSARLALMQHEGKVAAGDRLETCSLRETRFSGEITAVSQVGSQGVVENRITGRAYVLGHTDLVVNLEDPLVDATGLDRILSPYRGQVRR